MIILLIAAPVLGEYLVYALAIENQKNAWGKEEAAVSAQNKQQENPPDFL